MTQFSRVQLSLEHIFFYCHHSGEMKTTKLSFCTYFQTSKIFKAWLKRYLSVCIQITRRSWHPCPVIHPLSVPQAKCREHREMMHRMTACIKCALCAWRGIQSLESTVGWKAHDKSILWMFLVSEFFVEEHGATYLGLFWVSGFVFLLNQNWTSVWLFYPGSTALTV